MAGRKRARKAIKMTSRTVSKAVDRKNGFSIRSLGITVPAVIIALLFVGAFIYGAVLEKQGAKNEPASVTQNFIDKDADLQVHYIDVGQGDCSLICYNGINILTDAGEKEYGDTVVKYLQKLGIAKLDYVIASHPHSDHIGGLAEVIKEFDIGTVIAPKVSSELTPTSSSYENFLKALKKKGVKLTAAKAGTVYSLANPDVENDNTAIEIIAPVNSNYDNLNDFSVVFKLTHGSNSFLFMGDAQKEAEDDILASGAYVAADVLKVGHHGSSTSTKKKFLEAVMPKYAVIECGKDNSYNHPNQDTVDRLEKYDVEIYRTDNDGNIVFYSDGTDIRVVKESDADNADN